ncbi:MAG: hypothetical protein AAB439_01060 [Patescibacteria group bacterium]
MKGKKIIIGVLTAILVVAGVWFLVLDTPTTVAPTPTESTGDKNTVVCIQVITPARNLETGVIKEFPTPCDVPEGWEVIENDIPTTEIFLESQ